MKKILRTQLLARLEQEYSDYLDELHGADIDTVISSSDKTNFYANMLAYIREHDLFENQLKTLLGYEKPLENLYYCFCENNFDLLARADTARKVIFQIEKEDRHEDYADDSEIRGLKISIFKDRRKYLSTFDEYDAPAALNGRIQLIKAASRIVNKDLSYVNGIDGLSDYLYYEQEVYEEQLEKIGNNKQTLYPHDGVIERYAMRIFQHAEPYGWDVTNITDRLKKYMDMEGSATM